MKNLTLKFKIMFDIDGQPAYSLLHGTKQKLNV